MKEGLDKTNTSLKMVLKRENFISPMSGGTSSSKKHAPTSGGAWRGAEGLEEKLLCLFNCLLFFQALDNPGDELCEKNANLIRASKR